MSAVDTTTRVVWLDAVDAYVAAGWNGTLPLPPGRKHPPPAGYTGEGGRWPSDADRLDWHETRPADSNLALRMPPDVVGIDIDHYGTKTGADDLEAFRQRRGLDPLPATWLSTARTPPSGIRFYRVPDGARLRDTPAPGVEIVQHHHRYAVVWPSMHPSGTAYRWHNPAGEAVDKPPEIDELPGLPARWLDALTAEQPAAPTLVDNGPADEHREPVWSPAVVRALDDACAALRSGTSRHDAAREASMRLARLEQLGHAGSTAALDDLGGRFVAAVTQPGDGQRSPDDAAREWRRMLTGARDLARTTPSSPAPLTGAASHQPDDTPTPPPATTSLVDRLRDALLDTAAVRAIAPPDPLIAGYLNRDSLATLYGPSGGGKTFLALDWALHVATGRRWNLRDVQTGPVLYVIAEGASGVGRRIDAWSQHHQIRQLDRNASVHWLPQAVNLADAAEAAALAEVAAGLGPVLVVVDTLARCILGAEENSARDMGLVVANLDTIRRATRACVLVVHHTGKDGTNGARGSSALRAAMDAELELTAIDHRLVLKVTKQKDGAEQRPLRLDRVAVAESCVLAPAVGGLADTLGPGDRETLEALERIQQANGVTASDWMAASGAAKRTFYDRRRRLVSRGLVENKGGRYVVAEIDA